MSPFVNPVAPKPPQFPAKAKSVIFLFMYGGPSHVDTFDYKPKLYPLDGKTIALKTFGRGGKKNEGRIVGPKWEFQHYGQSGKYVSTLFPNRAAICDYPEAHFTMVRPGIMLYGSYPDKSLRGKVRLKPVMRWTSFVGFVRTVPAKSSLSYGRTCVTERETRVAYVPIGYADGYPRSLSNRGTVLIKGRRCRIMGTVCMEWVLADVTGVAGRRTGRRGRPHGRIRRRDDHGRRDSGPGRDHTLRDPLRRIATRTEALWLKNTSRGSFSRSAGLAIEVGGIWIMLMDAAYWTFRRPFRFGAIFKQMEFIGVKSLWVVIVTGGFTGMVLALQTYYGFRRFSSEGLVGTTVALSMTRELGPVLTGLMVTGRAGSAIAAELGSMRVTEQIDALTVMALNPIKYLVVPRVVAALLMLPILTVIADFTGIVGGYFVGVKLLGINEGVFVGRMVKYVESGRYL